MSRRTLFHKELDIPKDNPFVNCKLERERYADVLTGIVENYSDGFVLAINNEWGQGKTTFVKMWQQKLENSEFKTLYFNAWENDFQGDIILALISELEGLSKNSEEKFDNLLHYTSKFIKKAAPAAIKGVIGKLVGDEAVGDVAKAIMEFTAEEVESSIKEFKEKKKGIIDFKESLEKFANAVDDEKPIIFFIDELDRCRPDYSVKLLEKVKHFFNVPGIVFVLSIDKRQLCYAINGAYGSDNFNSTEYLRRFIDVEYSIPIPKIELFVDYIFNYFEFGKFFDNPERLKIEVFKNDKSNFKGFATKLFNYNKLNLRQIEKIFSLTKLVLNTLSERSYLFPSFMATILFLKIYKEESYNKISNLEFSPQQLVDEVEALFPDLLSKEEITSIQYLLALFLSIYINSINRNILNHDDKIQLIVFDKEADSNKAYVKSKFDRHIRGKHDILAEAVEFYDRFYNYDLSGIDIAHFTRKVDLMEQFKIS